jgi:hypothetical protein
MKQIIFIFSILFVFVSCNSDDSDNKSSNVTYSEILKGDIYNGKDSNPKGNLVIKDQTTWNDVLSKMNLILPANMIFPDTNIDFTKYQVIAVFDQVRNYGGYSIDITKITETRNRIIVKVEQLKPGGIATVITQPYHIIKMPKNDKKIVFE